MWLKKMSTYISLTLPDNLSPEETKIVQETLQVALTFFGHNGVELVSMDARAGIPVTPEDFEHTAAMATMARKLMCLKAEVDIIDPKTGRCMDGDVEGCCPCCGVEQSSLRGIGSSIW